MTKTVEKKTEEVLLETEVTEVTTQREYRKTELEAEQTKLNERLDEIKDLLKLFD